MDRRLELSRVEEIARGTIELTFQRPEGFDFLAGQNLNLKVPELLFPDPKGPRRTFTIASAPHESVLRFATRLSGSGYKQTLLRLAPGSRFVYDPEVESAAYMAGGIGITPFRSMLLHGAHVSLKTPTFLFYGNADPESSAWHELFAGLAQTETRFTYIPTMTNLAPEAPWPGERRWLSADLAADYLPDSAMTTFFLCGPPAMITALTDQLHEKGIEDTKIRHESLWGY